MDEHLFNLICARVPEVTRDELEAALARPVVMMDADTGDRILTVLEAMEARLNGYEVALAGERALTEPTTWQ